MKQDIERHELVLQGEEAFIELASVIDHTLELIGFYIDRHCTGFSPSQTLVFTDLRSTVSALASGTSHLAEVVRTWKAGGQLVLSVAGVEVNIINELWLNLTAALNFLISKGIDIEGDIVVRASTSYHRLVALNRVLT